MDDLARLDIECDALAASHALRAVPDAPDRCGASPTGYDVRVYCERPPDHEGTRHWCETLNWPVEST